MRCNRIVTFETRFVNRFVTIIASGFQKVNLFPPLFSLLGKFSQCAQGVFPQGNYFDRFDYNFVNFCKNPQITPSLFLYIYKNVKACKRFRCGSEPATALFTCDFLLYGLMPLSTKTHCFSISHKSFSEILKKPIATNRLL